MPGCLHGKEEGGGPDKAPDSVLDWREPPGYLGEAVRRAKRISSIAGQTSKPLCEDCRED